MNQSDHVLEVPDRVLENPARGIGTVRRAYLYVVSFAALIMAAIGAALVGGAGLDSLFVRTDISEELATGMALTIVGVVLWQIHWRAIRRHVRELPIETRSTLRKIYLYVVLAVAVNRVAVGVHGILLFVFGSEPFNGWSWAAVVVFGAVWRDHWKLETSEGCNTPKSWAVRRVYLYGTSAVSLVVAATGVARILHLALLDAYQNLTGVTLRPFQAQRVGLWNYPTREYLALALVAGSIWAAHWLWFARGDVGSVLRRLYANVLAVLGGTVTILVSVSFLLYEALIWGFGVSGQPSASSHFLFVPVVVAALMVGAAVLAHHWVVATRDAQRQGVPTITPRASVYTLGGLGVVAFASSVAVLVAMFMDSLGGSSGSGSGVDAWREPLALALTLAAIGAPLWSGCWIWAQRRVAADSLGERSALSRRVNIFAVLSVGMLSLLSALSHLVFVIFHELLNGDLSNVAGDAKFSIGIVVAAALFLPYHWFVYRTDKRTVESETGDRKQLLPRKAVTMLVNEDSAVFVSQLEEALGYRISSLRWADAEAGHSQTLDLDAHELVERISNTSGSNVLIIPNETGVRVFSHH